jgi:hypothetical protein
MAAAMNRFIQHLPGPHTWRRDDVSHCSDVELQHIAEWKTYMQDITDAVKQWWKGLVIPEDADLASLTTGLADDIANILSALEKVPSSGSNDDPAVPAGRGATQSSSSSSCHFPPQSVQRALAVIEGAHLMPGQPPQLLRVLLGAARRQHEYASRTFRQANIRRDVSISLTDRLAVTPPNLPHHGGLGRPHAWSQTEGTQMGVLFGILLEELKVSGIIARVQAGKDGRIPVQTYCAAAFHKSYSVDFRKLCGMAWDELPTSDQHLKLAAFLKKKFSTDKQGVDMCPDDMKRRKTLQWTGFFILDIELPQIVDRVMIAWNVYRHHT